MLNNKYNDRLRINSEYDFHSSRKFIEKVRVFCSVLYVLNDT